MALLTTTTITDTVCRGNSIPKDAWLQDEQHEEPEGANCPTEKARGKNYGGTERSQASNGPEQRRVSKDRAAQEIQQTVHNWDIGDC